MSQLTDTQRMIAKTLDLAGQSVIAYSAPEVPELGNATPQALLEEWGRLNEARKAIEKVEKIVKNRFMAIKDGDYEDDKEAEIEELRGDNFNWKRSSSPTTRLNQSKAKETLAEYGVLEDHLNTSEVTKDVVKRN
jgi:hypothetical protein